MARRRGKLIREFEHAFYKRQFQNREPMLLILSKWPKNS